MDFSLCRAGRAAPVIGAVFLAGCFHEVALTPRSPARALEPLPVSTRVELTESVSGGKIPIRFDAKKAISDYFKSRGTFRGVTDGASDTVLQVASRFKLSSQVSFVYEFELQAALLGGGRALGSYLVRCSATGGAVRFSSSADLGPMNEALGKCLDDLAGRIEANGPSVVSRLGGGAPPLAAPTALLPALLEPAFSSPARPDDLAVVIGVESYSDIATKAPYAERDADAVKAHLRALGVPERNIVLLKGAKAGKASIEKYVETWLPQLAKPDGRVYFYFSGHGAPDVKTGKAYLVPWDGDPNFLENTAVPLDRLYAKLAALPSKRVLVAMDSCFSGAGGRSVLATGARPLVTRVDTSGSPAKLTILSASAANEISGSLDDKGHGAFTYFLLQGLDAGKTTPKALTDYLTPQVQDEARRLNRSQTPQLQGDGSWSLR